MLIIKKLHQPINSCMLGLRKIQFYVGKMVYCLVRPFAIVYERYRVHNTMLKIVPRCDYHVDGPIKICGTHHISIGKNFSAGSYFRLEAIDSYFDEAFTPSITIGDNVSFQDYCHVGCVDSVSIGDGTLVGSDVLITDHNHGYITPEECDVIPVMRCLSHAPVTIGKNVWLGDGVKIMRGVELGDSVIVGANSVVTHSFPSNVVIAGIPARIIKHLDPNI